MTVNWNRKKYTQDQLIEAWSGSQSIAEVARKLGCNRTGNGYISLKAAAESLGLSRDGMDKRPDGPGFTNGRTLKAIMIENSPHTNTNGLKKRLYAEGILEKKCSVCGIVEWCGKPAPLAMDHINGTRSDNRIENLRILCYNCHGQTETYAGKKNKIQKGQVRNRGGKPTTVGVCPNCGKDRGLSSHQPFCISCRNCYGGNSPSKIDWPPVEELVERLRSEYAVDVAKSLGISDNALKKHLKRRGAWTPRKKGPRKKT